MPDQPETTHPDRAALVTDYASFWWAQESGETETWDELDADEREAVIENSFAEHVTDWFIQRMAALDWYVGKVPGYHVEVSTEATSTRAEGA